MPYAQAISIRTLLTPIVNLFDYLDTKTDMNLSCKDVDNYVYTHEVCKYLIHYLIHTYYSVYNYFDLACR